MTLRDFRQNDLTRNDGTQDGVAAADADVAAAIATATTIYVCITCRGGADFEPVPTPGAVLADATMRAAAGTGITVLRVRCLPIASAGCPPPCGGTMPGPTSSAASMPTTVPAHSSRVPGCFPTRPTA